MRKWTRQLVSITALGLPLLGGILTVDAGMTSATTITTGGASVPVAAATRTAQRLATADGSTSLPDVSTNTDESPAPTTTPAPAPAAARVDEPVVTEPATVEPILTDESTTHPLVPTEGASPLDPSGVDAPVGDLPGWKQNFLDNFSTDVPLGQFPQAVSDKWGAYPRPWTDTTNKGNYDPQKVVSIDGGVLDKHLRTDPTTGEHLVAALTPRGTGTTDRYGQLYGRYSVRMRSDSMPGYKIAWLLWPDVGTNTKGSVFSDGGGDGEIDFPETELDATEVGLFVHHQGAVVSNDQTVRKATVDIREWHTYTFEWSPNLVVAYIDGVETGRVTKRIPKASMHWVIQTETSIINATPDLTSGHLEIDWIAQWSYDADTFETPPAPTYPYAAVTSPAPRSTVSNDVIDFNISENLSDAIQLHLYVDGVNFGWDGTAPFSISKDISMLAEGDHWTFAKIQTPAGWYKTEDSLFTIDRTFAATSTIPAADALSVTD